MKIAITGGAGFIGSHLTRAYLNAGHDVFVIDNLVNGSRQAVDSRARFYAIDIRDGKLQALLQEERPDIVSHHVGQRTASVADNRPLNDADVHIRGLLNVLDSCVNASVSKFIFASGGNSLYGKVEEPLVKENTPLFPVSICDINKVAGEWYVRHYTSRYGLSHSILRYADVYGEANDEFAQHPLTYFVKMLAENRRPVIRGTASEVRDHIFIDDVVRANLQALEHGNNLTMHISSGNGFTRNQFYYVVAQMLRSSLQPVYLSDSLSDDVSVVMDNTLARRALGWHPEIGLSEGVHRTIRLVQPVEEKEAGKQGQKETEKAGQLVRATALA